jgi:hypothetical protein
VQGGREIGADSAGADESTRNTIEIFKSVAVNAVKHDEETINALVVDESVVCYSC